MCGITFRDQELVFARYACFLCRRMTMHGSSLMNWLACVNASPAAAAHVPLFLYPFLNTSSKTRPFEYLRLTSLGVIGALVKVWLYAHVLRLRCIC